MPFFVIMSRFLHLIFDLDGTLVDTRDDLAAATNHMLRELGLPALSVEQVESFIGLGAFVLIERALGPQHADLVADGFTIFMDYYNAHLLDLTKPYPGIESLLATGNEHGKILSVLTNKPEQPTRAILSGLGLAGYFQIIIGGDTLPKKKPDPEGIYVLQKETLCPLTDTLLIGDSDIDIRTGKAAGVATCGVTWGFGKAGFEGFPPTFLAESTHDIQQLVLPN